MTDNSQHTDKVYYRQFSAESSESLALVAKHIVDESNVLDVGCGAGDLGGYLRNEKNCYVVGVDYSNDSVAIANTKLNQALQIDLNTERLDECVNDRFDVIVMADILEHIYNPESVLRAAQNLLTPQGKIIISIPNAGYVGALLSLYDDSWRYREEGILDRTHVRFYTKQSVMELLAESGFDGTVCDRVYRDLLDSEFTQRIDSQPHAVRDWLLAKPEGSSYQFIIEARPQNQQYQYSEPSVAIPMSIQHLVKCYWQSTMEAPFEEAKFSLQRGLMGQKNRLKFPVSDNIVHKIRLDFADRRSIYRIEKIQLFNDTNILWDSLKDDYKLNTFNISQDISSLSETVLAIDDLAYVECQLGIPIQGDNLGIEVTLTAPISETNIAFADTISLSQYKQAVTAQTDMASSLGSASNELNVLMNTIEAERSNLKELTSKFTNLTAQAQQLKEHNDRLAGELARHQEHIDNLYQSTSWKFTAPLRKIISLFK